MAFENTTAGDCSCPACGHAVVAKVNKKGHLYVYCAQPADGGCGGGYVSRSNKADGIIAARVTKWRDPEARKHFMQWVDDPPPAPAPEDEPDELPEDEPPAPIQAPPPAPTPTARPSKPIPRRQPQPKTRPWWEREL